MVLEKSRASDVKLKSHLSRDMARTTADDAQAAKEAKEKKENPTGKKKAEPKPVDLLTLAMNGMCRQNPPDFGLGGAAKGIRHAALSGFLYAAEQAQAAACMQSFHEIHMAVSKRCICRGISGIWQRPVPDPGQRRAGSRTQPSPAQACRDEGWVWGMSNRRCEPICVVGRLHFRGPGSLGWQGGKTRCCFESAFSVSVFLCILNHPRHNASLPPPRPPPPPPSLPRC